MSLIPNQVNNFRIYAGPLGQSVLPFLGIADLTLPNIVNQTDELRGGGIAGPIQVPVIGHFEDLALTMTFFSMFPGNSIFLEQTSLSLQANGVIQYLDNSTNAFSKQPWQFLFTTFPKEFNPGRWQQGAKPDMIVSRVITAMQIFNNGTLVAHLDKTNMVCLVDGFDYLAQDRAWL